MTRLVTRALALLSSTRRTAATGLSVRFCDGFLCVRSGGVDGFGEVVVDVENRSEELRVVQDVARLELISAAGRRLHRLSAEARQLHDDADEVEFDGKLSPGGRKRLRWRVLLDDLEPGEELRLRGTLGSDGGAVVFETPPLLVGAVLGRGDVA
jgi:hypothetical protein